MNMNFGQALALLKEGKRVARAGWNGKGMFLFLVPGSTFTVNRPPLLGIYPEGTQVKYHAHVDMKTAQGDVVPWLCSQTDMLAEDWNLVGAAAHTTKRERGTTSAPSGQVQRTSVGLAIVVTKVQVPSMRLRISKRKHLRPFTPGDCRGGAKRRGTDGTARGSACPP